MADGLVKTFINVSAESSPALCYIAFSLLELKSTDTAPIRYYTLLHAP